MAISRIVAQDSTGDISSISYPAATTSGNLLVLVIVTNGTAPTITGGGWNVFTETWRSSFTLNLYWRISTGQLGIAFSGGGGIIVWDAFEFAGNNATQPDSTGVAVGNNNGIASVSSWPTPGISTSNANDLLFSVVAGDGTASDSPSWATSNLIGKNQLNASYQLYCGQNIVSSTQSGFTDTLTYGSTSSAGASAISIAFQASGGSLTPQPLELMLLGIG